MGTPIKDMRAALKRYLDSVEQTLTELSELEELSETFATILRNNDELNDQTENAVRTIGNLQAQRQDLYQGYFNASFEGETERVEEIENERDTLDARIAELERSIEDLRSKLVKLDGEAVAELVARLWETRSPKFGYDYMGLGVDRVDTNHTGWSELVKELESGDKELKDEVLAANERIEGKADWKRLADEDTLRERAPEVADYLFGTLKSKERDRKQHERFVEAKKTGEQTRRNRQAILRELDQVI